MPGSTSTFWMRPTAPRCITIEGSKEELVRDVSRFYSSSHDRFTYGSSFINFNLPQFYQIVNVDGRAQVIPFRTQAVTPAAPANQDTAPLLQQYFS